RRCRRRHRFGLGTGAFHVLRDDAAVGARAAELCEVDAALSRDPPREWRCLDASTRVRLLRRGRLCLLCLGLTLRAVRGRTSIVPDSMPWPRRGSLTSVAIRPFC